jgi:hypothetical protein
MANIIYNAGLRDLLKGAKAFDTATYKALLEDSTSTYAPNKDDDNIGAFSGFVELPVANVPTYARQTIGSPTIVEVDASDLVKISCGNIVFGNLEAGKTVRSIIIYQHQAGGDGNCVPLIRIDTDSGGLLPRALGGGAFTIDINASGLVTVAQS